MKTALTIAGSDSSGGAGIQADIKTMTANGVYAMSAITALTAQNTTGVQGIFEVSPDFLAQQLDSIFTDIRPDAVKIGMVSSTGLIEVIARKLREYRAENIVVDPVMVATSGAKLISDDAIAALKAAGVTKTVMLTGDIQKVADYVARDLGVDEVRAELLPADKVARVEELLKAEPEGAKLAFVGDGINDAPVLSRADIGIAMGAMGSDAAIEAADVVLMDDDPMKIAKAIKISRKCIRIVHENIVFSLGVKLLCLLLVALGFANMWMGIFADVGVMVLAVLNAIRALRVHDL